MANQMALALSADSAAFDLSLAESSSSQARHDSLSEQIFGNRYSCHTVNNRGLKLP
jgi:hypothetical protein